MTLDPVKTLYGIHSVVLFNRSNAIPYGILRVLAGSSLNISGEIIQLTGGSSKFVWDAQDGNATAELALKIKEIPNWLFGVLLGKTPTKVSDDPGSVAALTNVLNDSIVDAVTGIDSVGVKTGSEADLKFGKYTVIATSPTAVDVYAMTNVDFSRGTDVNYVDSTLKVTAAPLTIVTAGVKTELTGFGVEFTGPSGAVGMTAGDTAEFWIYPPSTEKTTVQIGGLADCTPEFGAIVTAQKKGDGSVFIFTCYRVKAFGFPLNMEEKAFGEMEVTAIMMRDEDEDAVFSMEYVNPVNACG